MRFINITVFYPFLINLNILKIIMKTTILFLAVVLAIGNVSATFTSTK